MFSFTTYQENLYKRFLEIDPIWYEEKEKFYEKYRTHFADLDEEQVLEIRLNYVEALFEQGKYEKVLSEIDQDVCYSIDKNITSFMGIDVYRRLLELKGASLYNTLRYEEAIHVFKNLVRIYPNEKTHQLYLYSAHLRQDAHRFYLYKIIAAATLVLSATVIAAEIFYVRQYQVEWTNLTVGLRNTLFFSGMAILAGSEIISRWQAYLKQKKSIS